MRSRNDIASRMVHVRPGPPEIDVHPFSLPTEPRSVWSSPCGNVEVAAVGVHHEPIAEAAAYRVETPDGVVVVSGDTRVCTEMEELCRGADLLVHEACRTTSMMPLVAGSRWSRDDLRPDALRDDPRP